MKLNRMYSEVTIVAILATFLVQTFTDSMIFGALAGVLVFFISGVYKWRIDINLLKVLKSCHL